MLTYDISLLFCLILSLAHTHTLRKVLSRILTVLTGGGVSVPYLTVYSSWGCVCDVYFFVIPTFHTIVLCYKAAVMF